MARRQVAYNLVVDSHSRHDILGATPDFEGRAVQLVVETLRFERFEGIVFRHINGECHDQHGVSSLRGEFQNRTEVLLEGDGAAGSLSVLDPVLANLLSRKVTIV